MTVGRCKVAAEISSPQEVATFLRGRESRLLCLNTRAHAREGGTYAIRLHQTDVVTYLPDGSVVLNTGGWASAITADRMDRFTPANVRVSRKEGCIWATVDGAAPQLVSSRLVIRP